MTIQELNALSESGAADVLRSCCGASKWVDAMVAGRPYASTDDVLVASDNAWSSTDEADWREAFAHHPRIGEKKSAVGQGAQAASWSQGEQSLANGADPDLQDELVSLNRAYEEKFGHIYIVCATGRAAGELLVDARGRMSNDAATELGIAASEQHKITQLRLRKLFGESA